MKVNVCGYQGVSRWSLLWAHCQRQTYPEVLAVTEQQLPEQLAHRFTNACRGGVRLWKGIHRHKPSDVTCIADAVKFWMTDIFEHVAFFVSRNVSMCRWHFPFVLQARKVSLWTQNSVRKDPPSQSESRTQISLSPAYDVWEHKWSSGMTWGY